VFVDNIGRYVSGDDPSGVRVLNECHVRSLNNISRHVEIYHGSLGKNRVSLKACARVT